MLSELAGMVTDSLPFPPLGYTFSQYMVKAGGAVWRGGGGKEGGGEREEIPALLVRKVISVGSSSRALS